MRRSVFRVCIILLGVGPLIWVSCSLRWLGRPTWQPPDPVAILGEKQCSTFRYWPWPTFFRPTEEGKPVYLLLREGELFLTKDGDRESILQYRKSDGTSLTVSHEEARDVINGKTVTLGLDQEEAWKWLEKATPEEMETLRLIGISPKLEEQQISLLKRLSKHNPNVGLFIQETEVLRQSLPLFDPVFLSLSSDVEPDVQDFAILRDEKRIRTLFLGENEMKLAPTFLPRMASLETLIILGWNPTEAGPLPEDLTNLKRLILISPELKDLTMLGNQPNLEELSLVGSPLDYLAGLSNYRKLKVLVLHGCGNVKDLTPLRNLNQLKWLGLPPTTTQEQLEEILREHPGLVVLELFEAGKVIDLTPITDLRKLGYLLVNCPNARPDPLFEMKNLRWLAVSPGKKEKKEGKEAPREEDLAVRLQKALPQTAVVRVEPLCLGSGWILLLAPAVVMAWWLTRAGGRNRPRMEADSVRVSNHQG